VSDPLNSVLVVNVETRAWIAEWKNFSNTVSLDMTEVTRMGREISTDGGAASRRLPRDAVVTIAALLLVFAAFDDITTDNATSFPLEYTTLVAVAVWLLFIAVRLMRHGHGLLGGISLVALASAVWGQRAVGPGVVWGQRAAGFKPEYVAVMAAYGWFCALSLALLWRAWRERSRRVRQSG